MRKVLYKKWVPEQRDKRYGAIIKDTDCWEKEFVNMGTFLGWGAFDGGHTGALVELEDGSVVLVQLDKFKFYNEE